MIDVSAMTQISENRIQMKYMLERKCSDECSHENKALKKKQNLFHTQMKNNSQKTVNFKY